MFFCCVYALILIIFGITEESNGVNGIIIKVKSQQKQIIFRWDEKWWHVKIDKNHASNSKTELLEEKKKVVKKELRNTIEKAFRGNTYERKKHTN